MQAFSASADIDPYNDGMSQGRPAKRQRSPFGQRLFELREAAGITQGEVAEALGISQSTYSDWERGSVAIHPDRLKELAEIVGTSVAELLGEAKPRRNGSTPGGRLGQNFEAISKLPRRQQTKILDVVEALLAQQTAEASSS